MPTVLLGLILSLWTGASLAQAQVEWRLTQPLSDAEKASVLALAARWNIDRPAVVIAEIIHNAPACEALRIESVPAVNGHRRTWQRIWITNTAWRLKCRPLRSDAARVDTWVLADRQGEVGAWRVEDRDGFVDVETPPTIPYRTVETIVAAIKTGNLVNRLPLEVRASWTQVPKLDAKTIFYISRFDLDASQCKVNLRVPNIVLYVVVQGTRVELRGWGTEMG